MKAGAGYRLSLLFNLLVAAGIFSYLFQYISFQEVLDIILRANKPALLVFFVLSLLMSIFRSWRYFILLKVSGYTVAKFPLFLIVIVRNFFSDLLPARIGTTIYIYLVNSRLGIPLAPALSSFSIAFLFDIFALAPLVFFAAWFAIGTLLSLPVMLLGAVILGVITLFLIFYLSRIFSFMGIMARKLLPDFTGRKIQQIFVHTEEEIQKAKTAGIYKKVLVLSLLVRIAKYSSFYVLFYALVSSYDYQLFELSIPGVFLGVSAAELSASLPISGIGGFGLYEGTWALIFHLLGYPEHLAKLTGVSHHLFTQVYGYLFGAFALLLLVFFHASSIKSNNKH